MQTLPPVVRTYLEQGKYSVVAQSLMSKYGLRIDQGGVLEREIMLLLMGIENPDEFTQALATEARIDEKTIGSIVQDINAQIFMPLREEEMRSKKVNVGVPNYTAPAKVVPQGNYAPRLFVASQPTGVVGPPPQSPRYPNQEKNINAFVHRVPQTPPTPLNTGRPPSISVITPPTPSLAPAPAETPLRQALRAVVPPTSLPGAPRPAEAFGVGGLPPSDIMPPRAPLIPQAPRSGDPYRESFE